jgi:hypothetical protein
LTEGGEKPIGVRSLALLLTAPQTTPFHLHIAQLPDLSMNITPSFTHARAPRRVMNAAQNSPFRPKKRVEIRRNLLFLATCLGPRIYRLVP